MFRIMTFILVILITIPQLSYGNAENISEESAILHAGDVIYIRLPGEDNFNKEFSINRMGTITLEEVGDVKLEGLSIEAAENLIKTKLSTVFRDVDKFSLSLRKRSLIVTVLGYVNAPKSVTLPPDGNVQMAINEAGGLKAGAQLDKVQIRRNKEVIHFNYKSYLDSGDVSILPKLVAKDIIFIPVSPLIGNVQIDFDAKTLTARGDASDDGNSIQIFGEVLNPGTFAYKEGASVVDIIMRAGGVTRYAGVEQIRVIHGDKPLPFNLKHYLDTADKKSLPAIGAGDIIFVPQKISGIDSGSRTVYVIGEAKNPGAFEIQNTVRFIDILANAGGPTRYADTRQLRILKSDNTVVTFDLYAYTENPSKVALPRVSAGDAILIPHKARSNENSWLNTAPNRAVEIIGAVHKPGRYEWSSEMSLFDLIGHAGGPKQKADTHNIEIMVPTGADKKNYKTVSFDMAKFIKNGGSTSDIPVVKAGSVVMIHELPHDPTDNKAEWIRQASEHSIYVFGEVEAPGRYAFNSELNFLDLLSAADGPTKNADMRNIIVTHRNEPVPRTSKVNLTLYFESGDETLIPKIKPQDSIYIPARNSNWLDVKKEETVRVLGAVHSPGRYRFEDSMTILDLLAEAGGPNSKAYQEKIVVVNVGSSADQARIFNLVEFAKTGNFNLLPLLKVGDTIYVPDISQSNWRKFIRGVKDVVSVLSIPALIGGL